MPKDPAERVQAVVRFVDELKAMPIAINTSEANEQHYEVNTMHAWHDTRSACPGCAPHSWCQCLMLDYACTQVIVCCCMHVSCMHLSMSSA